MPPNLFVGKGLNSDVYRIHSQNAKKYSLFSQGGRGDTMASFCPSLNSPNQTLILSAILSEILLKMCYCASGSNQSYTYPASCFECVNRGKMVFCFLLLLLFA